MPRPQLDVIVQEGYSGDLVWDGRQWKWKEMNGLERYCRGIIHSTKYLIRLRRASKGEVRVKIISNQWFGKMGR